MKKSYLLGLMAAASFVASSANAEIVSGPAYGLHWSGGGTIESTYYETTADFSVRFNENAPGQWIRVEFDTTSRTIWVSNHAWFMCKVRPGDAYYTKALDILRGFRNGMTIRASNYSLMDFRCATLSMTLDSGKTGADGVEIPLAP